MFTVAFILHVVFTASCKGKAGAGVILAIFRERKQAKRRE